MMETMRLGARLARARPGETLVAVLGVALGIGALVGVLTLIRGYDDYQERLSRNPLSREMGVAGYRGQRDSGAAVAPIDASGQEPLRLSLADGAKAQAEVEGIATVYQYSPRRFSTAPLSASGARNAPPPLPPDLPADAPLRALLRERETALAEAAKVPVDEVALEQVQGMVVSPSFFGAYDLSVAKGSLFDEKDLAAGNNVVVIGSTLAGTLYKGQDALGRRIRLNGMAYAIIGVLTPDPWEDGTRQVPFDEMVFTPQQARSIRTADGRTIALAGGADSLALMARAGGSPARTGRELQAWFDRGYGEGRVRVFTAAARFQREVSQRRGVLLVLTILAGAAAAAAAVNLFNIMAGRVLKRSRSYGIMRAVGAPSNAVLATIMVEACYAAGAGALLSLGLSPLLFSKLEGALTAAAGNRVPVHLDPVYLLVATLASAGIAVLLVAAPARAAARAPIADALKSE